MQRTAGVFLALGVVAALATGACSGGDDTTAEETSGISGEASETTFSLPESRTATTVPDGSFLVAQALDAEIKVWDQPGDPEDFTQTLAAADETSGILTFLVQERQSDGWLHVQLPTAPLGGTGYILEGDVVLTQHRFDIQVSRGAHTLKVLANGIEAFNEQVAIGPDTPPAGTSTFIKEALLPPPGSVYDPSAYTYGLAGAANSKQQFADGSGVVAIHAVENPATLGRDAPTGAIGMDRGVLERLYESIGLPLGTPVEIVD
jgi:hypothetical protein